MPEISLPAEVKSKMKLSKSRLKSWEYNNFRTCLSVSLPICFRGATPPRPDPSHPPSVVGGIFKRFGYKPPKIDRRTIRRFRRFVKGWLKHNLVPLTPDEIPSFDEWIASTPYSEARKVELTKVWNNYVADPSSANFSRVKSFIKDETYPEWKYPRLINSRIDAAKCYFGPQVQAVSDRLFSLSWFIKTVPVPDRPVVIRDELLATTSDEDYVFTDYTAFEAHFTAEVMSVTQCELFKYMIPDKEWVDLYCRTMSGENHLTFKHLSVSLQATRMSGEMDTSLSNGFSNLMLFLFTARERGARDVRGFVEGDDGLFRVTPSSAAPTLEDFSRLGFTIKIGHTKNLSEASFCGQVYDMSDLIVVTDIKEALLRFGWTNKKYVKANANTLMQLLRAKGYSLVYQYNGCPVLYELGRRILDLTDGLLIEERIYQGMDQWERAKLRMATAARLPERKEIGIATRRLVERLYGVSVEQQLALEAEFSRIEFGLYEQPFSEVHESWTEYFRRYSLDHWVADPCWLVRDESEYMSKLSKYECSHAFVSSLGG